MHATVKYLRDCAEYGPKKPVFADGLRGWWTKEGYYVCAFCAGRITGRGCALPPNCKAVWRDPPEPFGVCCVCSDEKAGA